MAIGDAVNGLSSISDGSYLDIQPGSGVEWIIHNLFYGGYVEIEFYNGTNSIKFDSDSAGGRLSYLFHLTNTYRIRIKNVNGSAIYIGYNGVQSK